MSVPVPIQSRLEAAVGQFDETARVWKALREQKRSQVWPKENNTMRVPSRTSAGIWRDYSIN